MLFPVPSCMASIPVLLLSVVAVQRAFLPMATPSEVLVPCPPAKPLTDLAEVPKAPPSSVIASEPPQAPLLAVVFCPPAAAKSSVSSLPAGCRSQRPASLNHCITWQILYYRTRPPTP